MFLAKKSMIDFWDTMGVANGIFEVTMRCFESMIPRQDILTTLVHLKHDIFFVCVCLRVCAFVFVFCFLTQKKNKKKQSKGIKLIHTNKKQTKKIKIK